MASSFPFPINTSGSYHQAPFGYSGRSWLSKSLRATSRSRNGERPMRSKMCNAPQRRNHPTFSGTYQVVIPANSADTPK